MMPILTHDRAARIDEIAAEMDRRGLVIESLEARLSHIDGIYKGAIDNLNHHQRQLDADGVEVGVSRQALFEVLAGIEAAIAGRADNEATPASDGLPEGWKAVFARRDGGDAAAWYDQGDQQWRVCPNAPPIEFMPNWEAVKVSASSLSEACLAANERFPVVKPEAPAKWVQNNQWCWQRSADRSLVHRMSDIVGLWGFIFKGETLAAFPTAEEAMAWADRERPVA